MGTVIFNFFVKEEKPKPLSRVSHTVMSFGLDTGGKRREAEDEWTSEPLSKMRKRRSVTPSERWLLETRWSMNTSGSREQMGKNSWNHYGKTRSCLTRTTARLRKWYQKIRPVAVKRLQWRTAQKHHGSMKTGSECEQKLRSTTPGKNPWEKASY